MIFPLNILILKNKIIFLEGVEKIAPTISFSSNMVKYKENEIPKDQMSTNTDDEFETNDEGTIIYLLKECLGQLSKRFVSFFDHTLSIVYLSFCQSVFPSICKHDFSKATGKI